MSQKQSSVLCHCDRFVFDWLYWLTACLPACLPCHSQCSVCFQFYPVLSSSKCILYSHSVFSSNSFFQHLLVTCPLQPCNIHCTVCLAMLSPFLFNMSPDNFHLLLFSCSSVRCRSVFFHSSVLAILLASVYIYKQSFVSICWWKLGACQTSSVYSSTFTLELSIFTFVAFPIVCGFRSSSTAVKVLLVFTIKEKSGLNILVSACILILTTRPWHVNSLTCQ